MHIVFLRANPITLWLNKNGGVESMQYVFDVPAMPVVRVCVFDVRSVFEAGVALS